jgi:hypothetical protein
MADGMQLDPDKLQVLDTAFHFAFIGIVFPVWGHAGDTEKTARMSRGQIRYAVVRPGSDRRAWIGLYDGRVHLAFIHTPEDVFLCSEQAENATFAQVGMGINPLGHESSRGCRCLPAKRQL